MLPPRVRECGAALTLALPNRNCLLSNNYQQDKCEDAIANLYKCCAQFYAKNGDDARTDGCPMPSVLRRKLKDMKIEEPTV